MNPGQMLQWFIVVAVVCISALYMLGKIAPHWRKRIAMHLQQARFPAWINSLGASWSGSSGCGSCDTCGSCAPKDKTVVDQS